MTTAEVARLLAIIASIYQNFHPASMEDAIEAWQMVLADYDKAVIESALKAYVRTDSQFAPTPGQLIQLATPKPDYMGEMEAWSLVRKAISNGYYGAEQEFEKLPPEIQKVLGGPSQLRTWAVDENFNENVAMSNFQRSYRTVLQRAEDERLRIATSGTRLRIGEK